MTNPLTQNLYTYCGNNPLIRSDPNGTCWHMLWILGDCPSCKYKKSHPFPDTSSLPLEMRLKLSYGQATQDIVSTGGLLTVNSTVVATVGSSGAVSGTSIIKWEYRIKTEISKLNKSKGCSLSIDNKPTVSNEKLNNIVNDLYKGQGGPNTIGNGTTMDAVRNEILTGKPTNGKFHTSKLNDYVNALEKRLRAGDLNNHDAEVAKRLLEDAKNALLGKKEVLCIITMIQLQFLLINFQR